ncbi:glycosyltransferase [Phormidesmis priestleyi]
MPIPIGAVVHDLHWDIFPDKFPQQYRDDRTKNLIEWLTKAGVTFAISEQTKQEITEFYGKQAGKVKTVMLAADTSVTSSLENAIVSNSEVGEPLFYYPASLGFTKNQLTLLQATLRLANQGFRFKVALTGWATEMLLSEQPVNLGYPEICRSFYQTHRDILSQYIEVFGYCELQKVESLYAESACVVLPSIYDGFGLPLPEALLRGIPAICSDIGVYNEQINLYNCHDRVQIFPAKDVDALSQRLESFLTHPLQRLEPQEAQSKFSRWTWNHVAQAYIEGLQESHR